MQGPYQYLNKGTYGHMGGILHAGLHGVFTTLLLLVFVDNALISILCGLFDAFIHYHIDWAKVQLNSKYGYKADKDSEFWILLGLDQYLHSLTYIAIVYYLINF
jgi:hypothetical protein